MSDYDSSSIEVLSSTEAVRKRPGMYFGNLDSAGMNRVVCEVIANAIDQYLIKQSTFIRIEFDGDLIRITDDGAGLPFEKKSPDVRSKSIVEYYFTTLHTSPTADLHAPHVHVNLVGVGLAAVNAVCDRLTVTSYSGHKKYIQRFRKGKALTSPVVEECNNSSGTSIELLLDREIFGEQNLDVIGLRKTLFEIAHFYPGIIVEFGSERFCAKNGLLDLAEIHYNGQPAQSGFDAPLRFAFEGRHNQVWVSTAAIGFAVVKSETQFISWVNGGATVLDGVHVNSMKSLLSKIGWTPAVAVIHTVMHDPKFAGPSKDAFISREAGLAIEALLTVPLEEFKRNEMAAL